MTALGEIKDMKDFIIKPADKGGKIVIWPVKQYLKEAKRQLSDTKYYEQQTIDHTTNTAFEIYTFLTYLNTNYYIDDDLFEFLSPNNPPRTPIFYMLPKIHKPDNPGRPIISGCNSPSANLSVFLDHYLKPIVQHLPSYIKDTDDFLKTVLDTNTIIPPNSILVTLDVQSLYTNIPQDEGTRICLTALGNFYENRLPLPLGHLRQMFHYILKYNYFGFNDKFYLQIHGTTMGTTFAPNYSNIFMGDFEYKALKNAPNNLQPLIWKRFIDDIFMIWTHGEESLLQFYNFLNDLHPTIKFDIEYSTQEIHFLDTTIYFNKDNKLESTLYVKPTDICALLHQESFHPNSCKQSVIYSQALRYRRVITDDDKLIEQLNKLRDNLLKRGHNITDINKQFNKVIQLTQQNLLHRPKKTNTSQNIIPFVIPYDETNKLIGPILQKHWHIIEDEKSLQELWPKRPILALKRNKNLRDHLVHTTFTSTHYNNDTKTTQNNHNNNNIHSLIDQ